MALIDQLKQQHGELSATLTKVRELGIGTEQGKALLFSAKSGLLAHLEKENRELYPALRKAAEADGKLKSLLDDFARDMESVASNAMQFFDKYSGRADGADFGRDFGKLIAVLSERIRKEEAMLYAEFAKRKLG